MESFCWISGIWPTASLISSLKRTSLILEIHKYLFCRTKVLDSSASWHVSWVLVVPWVSLFVYWSSVGLLTEELIIFSSSTVRVFTSIQEKAPTNGILVYYFLIVNCMSFSLGIVVLNVFFEKVIFCTCSKFTMKW